MLDLGGLKRPLQVEGDTDRHYTTTHHVTGTTHHVVGTTHHVTHLHGLSKDKERDKEKEQGIDKSRNHFCPDIPGRGEMGEKGGGEKEGGGRGERKGEGRREEGRKGGEEEEGEVNMNPFLDVNSSYPNENLSLGGQRATMDATRPASSAEQSKNMWNASEMRPRLLVHMP